jgi:hypothetical protein
MLSLRCDVFKNRVSSLLDALCQLTILHLFIQQTALSLVHLKPTINKCPLAHHT